MAEAIGIDVGHSAVKVMGSAPFIFPAAVAVAPREVVGIGSRAGNRTVSVGGKQYIVGDQALIHTMGRVRDGLADDWIDSTDNRVLLHAGYDRAWAARVEDGDPMVAIGLPSRLYAAQRDTAIAIAATTLGLAKDRVTAWPQPLAAYYSSLLDERGLPSGGRWESGVWVVIDIGYYTTDFGYIKSGIWSSAGQESAQGTYVAAKGLRQRLARDQGVDVTLRDAEGILGGRPLTIRGDAIDTGAAVDAVVAEMVGYIVDAAAGLFGNAGIDRADGVYLAGGGASLFGALLLRKWPHAVRPIEPRMAVARGLRRAALASELIQA